MIVTAKLTPAWSASALLLASAFAASAQNSQIRATLSGNGNGDTGKCTIEVEVDGAADVEISGDQARLHTLSGSPANFRRMQCSGPLPGNPADFRFEGVDGRGSQNLLRDPRQGRGVAVVRIEDRDGGREGYTFDILWSNRGSFNNNNNGGGFGNNGGFNNGNGGFNGTGNGRNNSNNGNGNWNGNGGWNGTANGWSTANAGQAMRACQNEVANRIRRNGYSDIQFTRAEFDNNRNRADSITGTARASQSFGNDQFSFACRVDFATGRLGDVRLNKR